MKALKAYVTFWLCIVATMCSAGASAGEPYSGFVSRLEVALSFGGHSEPTYMARFGTSRYVPELSAVEHSYGLLPTSGLSVSSAGRVAPLFLGIESHSTEQANASESEGGVPGGWITAGVAAVAGVVVLAGSGGGGGNDAKRNSGNETNCGVSGDVVGPNPPAVDPNCR